MVFFLHVCVCTFIKMEADSEKMSEYELARLERIKENRKMLEELFPDGTGLLPLTDSQSSSGDRTPERYSTRRAVRSPRKQRAYTTRYV